ncbi:hypothetical protein PDESU_05480 [Pontiella desulfatans]|uniref:alpha-L-fucosidase n=1 Tax=Pontiella desulfatans TaxID=2750659 RepID=A0A6C2U9W5_PONDE|nr:hypothetical protein PDESU_05480 [Pontiella desulfatans]
MLACGLCALSPLARTNDLRPDFQPLETDRGAWLDEAKFAMFIHWGISSQLERGEWVLFRDKMPVAEYKKLVDTFNPVGFNADEWMGLAKAAGMKYVVFTGKHHDGFALFRTEASDFNVVDSTPFGRDVLAELKAACNKHGLKLGIYYSHVQDWTHPGGAIHKGESWDAAQAGDFRTYLDTVALPQIGKLLERYEPAILWFDTPWQMDAPLGHEIVRFVRVRKPETLINSRLMYHGMEIEGLSREQRDELREMGVDYLSYRDRTIPAASPWPYWETAMTLNQSWGYNSKDTAWKTPEKVVQQLVDIVGKGGTYLLNVGPRPDGTIPEETVDILTRVGEWLGINGEAIYGAEPSALSGYGEVDPASLARQRAQEEKARKTGARARKVELEMDYHWLATQKAGTMYIHLFNWPEGDFKIDGFEGGIGKAYLLADRETEISFDLKNGTLVVDLPPEPLDDLATVLCLEMKLDIDNKR